MASAINTSTLTFNGKEIQGLKEAFYQAVFQNPALEQFHTIITGIKARQQMVFLGQFGLTGKANTNCTPTPNTGAIPTIEKFWTPAYVGDRIQECFADLLGSFFVWGLKNGVQKSDLTNTDFALFLEERFSLAAYECALRLAWLGNTAADIATNGGYLANTVDPGYFNVINGFWAQGLSIVAADSTKKISIPNNAGNSYANQAFTSADTTNQLVTNIMQNMIYAADFRLRGAKDRVIIATQSVVDQYARERKAVSNIELAYERVEDGIDSFKIDNIEVIPFQFLDRHIRSYENNGTKWNQPHRALFTTKSNLQFGTEETSTLTELDPFYDKKSKQYIVDYGFDIDVKIAEDYMVQLAY
jgi:hypothetical protein